jgi:hypothetical protein
MSKDHVTDGLPMCRLRKKVLKNDMEGYIRFIQDPRYLCTKCGRVANDRKNICKPYEL